jgi:hypothetical protein
MNSTLILLIRFLLFLVAMYYYWTRCKPWINKYDKHLLNPVKVKENIDKGRRLDWGISKEKNWKNTWNANNPISHKWLELIWIAIKTIAFYLLMETAFFTVLRIFWLFI